MKDWKPKYKSAGKLPVNSRITIEYPKKDGKPKIKFGYPRKDVRKQMESSKLAVILTLAFFLLVGLIFVMWYSLTTEIQFAQNCSSAFNLANGTNGDYATSLNISCIQGDYLIEWIDYEGDFLWFKGGYWNEDRSLVDEFSSTEMVWGIFFLFCIITLIPVIKLMAFIISKNQKLSAMVPKTARNTSFKSTVAIFKEVPKEKYVEVPLFWNVYLDYWARGEFSDYLERVEIREHPFSEMVVRKGKIKKKKRNIYYWYARFYFNKIPKTGSLWVKFR